jgi:hypothetical protein
MKNYSKLFFGRCAGSENSLSAERQQCALCDTLPGGQELVCPIRWEGWGKSMGGQAYKFKRTTSATMYRLKIKSYTKLNAAWP